MNGSPNFLQSSTSTTRFWLIPRNVQLHIRSSVTFRNFIEQLNVAIYLNLVFLYFYLKLLQLKHFSMDFMFNFYVFFVCFLNFSEFYYIQMEKYARQAVSEGIKSPDDLNISGDSEIYRVLNLHYNRNNHIEVSVSMCWI